jgi:hypothetical protein
MTRRLESLLMLAALAAPWPALAGPLDAITQKDASGGLKAALTQGIGNAVRSLGKRDGFLGNPKVKIPLPPKLAKAEEALRMLGMGREADELVTSMNRAAEAAVPEAKTLLVESVKQMSVQDAKSILTGGDDAATQYFRRTTHDTLARRFLPIVKGATAKVGVAQRYNEFAGKGAQLGLLDAREANLETYVTERALDGLYAMLADEERAIRRDPLGQSSKVIQRVFGAIK